MEKSVAKTNEQFFFRKLEPEDAKTLVQALETNFHAARDRLRDHQEKFENSSKDVKSNTSHSMYRCAHFVRTSHCNHSLYHICGSSLPDCVSKKVVSFHLSRDVSGHAQNTQHFILDFSSVPGLPRLLTSRNPCADSREPRGDGYTDPEPRTAYEPNRIVVSQTINEQDRGSYQIFAIQPVIVVFYSRFY